MEDFKQIKQAFTKIKEYQQMFHQLPREKRHAMSHQEIADYLDTNQEIVRLLFRGGHIKK
ncbi:hypothetical protein [Candidatus Uabimicrobium amorphum]|uniref:Uncharacterized protein n=1 Tax=Uabimicrobium amorphum TaxID=2596890 RepID=A0A5S9ITI1_UABAM|nr:hypothetical protein [Candidatus Uabimicrobium amorphum]BBM86870.1 hypothetical protein UABAM_05270 [Candidatus Uabimicrobium amorphum]